ncbi:MAG TPA: ABC transporter permease [Actinoplanes sp.]|nr:ABC transporter permease [Actinoplanes sp.]
MSTMTLHRPAARELKVTQARVVKSEWIKFWSLRSTVITLTISVAVFIGIGLLAASMLGSGNTNGPGAGVSSPITASLAGAGLAQLAFGTLGVLFMAGEYSTGMIRSSLAAVPKRLPVLWAKIAVFTGVVFVVALVASAIAFTGGQAIAGTAGASWSDPGVVRAVIGTAFVLTGSGVLGIGLGALLRSTPAAISTLFGAMFLVSGLAQLLLPNSWSSALQYLPSNAADSITAVTTSSGSLVPLAGLTVFVGYLVAVVAAAGWRLKRADA